ncbi:LuxR C-terminal-related transcriptional regulator [Streptomyces sp. NPDC093568]|uniref:response regulator transcription factor n=1 Tax=Streptomyces sp. NPDC093568 TaxID=3366041 RepID=UPI00380A54D3
MTPEPVRIVVVDDHRLPREALCHVLDSEPDLEAHGVDSGPSAVRAVTECRPDVVLLDIATPGPDPASAVRELLDCGHPVGIVVLHAQSDLLLMQRLLDLGVCAYLHKSVSQGLLLSTVRDIAGAKQQTVTITVPSGCARAGTVVPQPAAEPARDMPASDLLSARELVVLTLVAEALTNRQVASRMDITEATVKRHLRNIFSKLGATSRIDAVNKAINALVIQPPAARRDR